MFDPDTVAFEFLGITIWHHDPCKDGTDDSCGWFLRSRHLDKEVLKKIERAFEFEWDRTFENKYNCGWFKLDGDPNLSVQGIVLNMFSLAAFHVFGRKKANKYCQGHLFDILHFAENNTDSLFDSIMRKFEKGCNEAHTPEKRKGRISEMASCIYAYIARDLRPWYKHPRWHFWHWRVQIHWKWLNFGVGRALHKGSLMEDVDW